MKENADSHRGEEDRGLGPCPLCGREMLAGESVDRHHWRPKSRGGRTSAYLHRTCHRKLHSLFTEKELSSDFSTAESVRHHPEIRKFIAWVRRQPPETILRHRKPRGRK